MRALWAELKRRNVVRMALAYCAIAWLLLQVAALLAPLFDIPNSAMRWLVLLAVAGFPLAVLSAWKYAWSRAGLVREVEAAALGQAGVALQGKGVALGGKAVAQVGRNVGGQGAGEGRGAGVHRGTFVAWRRARAAIWSPVQRARRGAWREI